MRELERAITEDGCKGVIILSSLPGHYPDDDEPRCPSLSLSHRSGIPVFMHPPSITLAEERLNIYRLASSIGRPMDGALAISRLIVRGIFEKFPTLKLIASHLGGGICDMIGRMDYAYNLQEEAYFLGSYEPMLIKHQPPLLKMMYLELTRYGHRPRVMQDRGRRSFHFGTDAPPLKPLKKAGVAIIKSLKLSPQDEAKVFAENAKRLLTWHRALGRPRFHCGSTLASLIHRASCRSMNCANCAGVLATGSRPRSVTCLLREIRLVHIPPRHHAPWL